MIGSNFRPWGNLDWILPKMPNVKWDLIGCISTEDRSVATALELEKANALNSSVFFKITDPDSNEVSLIRSKLDQNERAIKDGLTSRYVIEEHRLLEQIKSIVDSTNKITNNCCGNIVVDISCFPKRFFFPIIKILTNAENIKNLIVTYSTPLSYCDSELSANPQSWDHIPLFMPVDFPEPQIDLAIVGVGFMPFGLPDLLLSKYNATPVKFLFPFPPGPPNYQRTWDFVRKIEKSFAFKHSDRIIRIDSNNMPDAFGFISRETDFGKKKAIFAPYGPKPFSLAMCIYAILNESCVYYTQPTYYSPHYSSGIDRIFCYPIILESKNLYAETS